MEFTYHGMIRYGFCFFNPNHAAALITCLLPFCWSIRLLLKNKAVVYPAVAAEILLYLALIFTYSRTGVIAVLVEGMIFLFLKNYFIHPEHPLRLPHFFPRRRFAVIMIAVLGIAAISCGFMTRCVNTIPSPDRAMTNRVTLFQGGLKMLADNPDGVGSGMSGMIYTAFYQPVESTLQYRTMVNSFLTFAVEYGIVWAYAVALGFILPVAAAVILLRKHRLSDRKRVIMLGCICILAGGVISAMGSSCFDFNVLGSDPGFTGELDRWMRILLLSCPVIAGIALSGVVISEYRRLYNHAGILLILFVIFTLSGSIGYLMLGSFYKSNACSYKVVEIGGGRWLKYAAGDKQNVFIVGGGSWDLKRIAEFARSRFPLNNIFIPLDRAAESRTASYSSKVILCGKNYLSAKQFPDCEQYWLLPEGPPPEKYPAGLKKIYLSRYDEAGYNHLWKYQPAQSTIPLEDIN